MPESAGVIGETIVTISALARLFLAVFAAFGLLATPASAAAPSPSDRAAVIHEIEVYFNAIDTLKCDFIQIAPDGSLSQGRIYIKRPGFLRVEYDPPVKFLMVGDGRWINLIDYEVNDVSRWAISDTPLKILVKSDLNLEKDVKIKSIDHANGTIRLVVSSPDIPGQQSITFLFAEAPLRLAQWEVTDGGGQTTRVALSNIETGIKLDQKLFTFTDPRVKRGPR
jgi:outer membrane lipoprotein-sorting protein